VAVFQVAGSLQTLTVVQIVLFGVNDIEYLIDTKSSEKKRNKQIDVFLLGSSSDHLFLLLL